MFSGGEEEGRNERYGTDGSIGMDIMDMVGDMPLVSILMWQKDAMPMHPEDLVAGMLAQAHSM
jgi:hypothetical protein